MAAVVTAMQGTATILKRVDDAEAGTGWSNIGGGQAGAAEASFAYQGTNLFNRKVTSTSGAGFYYDPTGDGGGTENMTATNLDTWMCKFMVSDYGGLATDHPLIARIGSGTSAYNAFVLAGTDAIPAAFSEYRPVGGLLVVPISAAELTAYNDAAQDAGAADETNVDYYGHVYKFTSSTAKNENCGGDAIDICRTDLSGTTVYHMLLTRGDGGDADGVWQDFVDLDEGTSTNRYGFGRNADGGGIQAYGIWKIGESGTATEFTDNDAVVTWLEHMSRTEFNTALIDLGNASTTVTDGSLHISAGTTTDVDSRANYVVEGSSGSLTFTGQLVNFRTVVLTAGCVVNDSAIVDTADLTLGGGDFEGGSTLITNAASTVACCDDPAFGSATGFNNCTWQQGGAGHAVEITSTGSYTWSNISFTVGAGGYGGTAGSNLVAGTGENDAVLFNDSGGAVTISVSGGDSPSVRNGAGATTTVLATNELEFTGLIDATEVRVYEEGTTTEIDGNENVFNGTVAFQIDPIADPAVDVRIFAIGYIPQFLESIDMTGGDLSIPIVQIFDRNYLNPLGGHPNSPEAFFFGHGFR